MNKTQLILLTVFGLAASATLARSASIQSFDTDDDDIHVTCNPSEDGLVVFVPHPYNCSLFFMCQGTVGIRQSCPAGLYFDTSLNVCNYPWNTNCVPTPRPTTAQPETTTTTEDDEDDVTTVEAEIEVAVMSQDTDDDDIHVVCPPPGPDGFVVFRPHPYNCNKYFMCVRDVGVAMRCPAHLHFDTSINVCNYPEVANCTPTPRPTTPPPTTTTTEADSGEDTTTMFDLEMEAAYDAFEADYEEINI